MNSPKTIKECWALPETSMFIDEHIPLPDPRYPNAKGDYIVVSKVRPLCGNGFDPDDIAVFINSDGRVMKVVSTPGGFAKQPL